MQEQQPSAQIAVRLQPRARNEGIVGLRDDVLIVRVSAPPLEGSATAALCRLIAKRARVAPSRVSVVRGATARDKLVRVDGVERDELLARLQAP